MHKGLDRRPGPLPDIKSDSQSVTFVMEVGHLPDTGRLVIRCDADGNVWAAIRRSE
jgi:hypothetical protein